MVRSSMIHTRHSIFVWTVLVTIAMWTIGTISSASRHTPSSPSASSHLSSPTNIGKQDITATPTPFVLEVVQHRFIVGFRTYALADKHERNLLRAWNSLPKHLTQYDSNPFALACPSPPSNASFNLSTHCARSEVPWLPLSFAVLHRHNPGSTLPTDFLLVEFGTGYTRERIDKAWEKLKHEHGDLVKYVMEEKRVTRALLEEVEADVDFEDEPTAELQALHSIRIPTAAKTTVDMDTSTEGVSQISSPASTQGVGEFPAPQRFDLGHATVQQSAQTPSTGSPTRRKLCQWGSGGGNSPTDLLKASHIWDKGFKGAGIKIAIFDTGLSKTHQHFQNIDERTNWTDENTLDDGLGHGTFVAGVIASSKDCLGFAPEAKLYVFRVFNQRQLSFTSWFLDAFNYAIHSHVHLLNLSIGGPDFLDRPFVEKVNEMTANGITVISAIGNDGPLWGTLNNPADQMDVIGVGGATEDLKVASFSSRGMTTAELPLGYGRMKPDLVTLARNIRGSNQGSGCKTMSGTSVASPVVAGAVTLLASTIPESERQEKFNSAFWKQVLLESSIRLPMSAGMASPGIFEQGEGSLSLEGAFDLLHREGGYPTHASIIPSKLDLTDCPYLWPFCTQGLFASSIPIIMNLTILNSQSVSSHIPSAPIFHASDSATAKYLQVKTVYPQEFYPFSGWFGVYLTLKEDIPAETVLSGYLEIHVQTDTDAGDSSREIEVIKLGIKVNAIPTPPRDKRILFDSFHNLRYPSGYFPRDNLEIKMDTLDWNGDHIHTNYRELYTYLREKGYFIEVLGRDWTCFDASLYSTLLLIDPEEEYFIEEISKVLEDVYESGLNLMILADWYNTRIMREVKFYDENTAEWWTPETGGSNIPALNSLLKGFGVELTDHVVKGDIHLAGETFYYASGTTIGKFPATGSVAMHHLMDGGSGSPGKEYPILGVYDPTVPKSELKDLYPNSGKLFLYGDSNCIDMNHRRGALCGSLIYEGLQFFKTGDRSKLFKATATPLEKPYLDPSTTKPPRRATGNNLIKYSKVTSSGSAPQCPLIVAETSDQAKASAVQVSPSLTAVSVYEQAHINLQIAAGHAAPPTSADEAKASSRFSSTLQKIHKKRRKAPEEDAADQPAPVTSSDSSKPDPVLAKQARLDGSFDLDSNDRDATERLFAQPGELDPSGQPDAKKTRQFWMQMGLIGVLFCIVLVAWIYRQQHALVGKNSPVQTPQPTPKVSQQPRSMVL